MWLCNYKKKIIIKIIKIENGTLFEIKRKDKKLTVNKIDKKCNKQIKIEKS